MLSNFQRTPIVNKQYSPRPEIITSGPPGMIPYLSQGCTVQPKGF